MMSLAETGSPLRDALEQAYAVFRTYPLKDWIESCPHCQLEEYEAALHGRPLRQLDWPELGLFGFKAMTTFGDVEDFKHFLPRLLELSVCQSDRPPYGFETLFSKLAFAAWQTWPPQEQSAVRSVLRCWRDAWAAEYTAEEDLWKRDDLEEELGRAGIAL